MRTIITIMFALVAMVGLAKEIKMNDSRGDRHLGYSSRHTQVPATTNCILDVLTDGILTECHPFV